MFTPGGYDVGVDRKGQTLRPRPQDGASFGTSKRFGGGPLDVKVGAEAVGALTAPADGGRTAFGKQALSTCRSQAGFGFGRGTREGHRRLHVSRHFMQ